MIWVLAQRKRNSNDRMNATQRGGCGAATKFGMKNGAAVFQMLHTYSPDYRASHSYDCDGGKKRKQKPLPIELQLIVLCVCVF